MFEPNLCSFSFFLLQPATKSSGIYMVHFKIGLVSNKRAYNIQSLYPLIIAWTATTRLSRNSSMHQQYHALFQYQPFFYEQKEPKPENNTASI
jgi:hypothetical protein